jgi:hypothetical protein
MSAEERQRLQDLDPGAVMDRVQDRIGEALDLLSAGSVREAAELLVRVWDGLDRMAWAWMEPEEPAA